MIQKKHLEDVRGLRARFRGYSISQEVEESLGDCDVSFRVAVEFDDIEDTLDELDKESYSNEAKDQFNDSGHNSVGEELHEPSDKENENTVQYFVHLVHIGYPLC